MIQDAQPGPAATATGASHGAGDGRVLPFVAIALSLSWAAWGAAWLLGSTPAGELARIAGSFGPSLTAVVVVVHAGGWARVRALTRRLVRLRGAGRELAIAAVAPPAVAGLAIAIDRALGGAISLELPRWWELPIIVVFVLVLGGPLGEELGWRGVLLPQLELHLGPLGATTVTGIVWAAWHLPLFALDGTVQQLIPLWLFAAQIVASSFVYTWLQHRAPASLVPALALHTSFNVTVGLLLLQPPDAPSLRPLSIALALLVVSAVALATTKVFWTPQAAQESAVKPDREREVAV